MTNTNNIKTIKDLIGNGDGMANDFIFTEGKFEWFKSSEDGYIYTRNTETGRNTRYNAEGQNGKRISDEVYFTKCNEAVARAEDAFEDAATDEQIDAAWAEVQQMIARGEVVEYTGSKMPEYKGNYFPVRGGAWNDPMNSCFYTVVDTINGYEICRDNSTNEIFAIRNLNAEAEEAHEEPEAAEEAPKAVSAPKAEKKARRAKKNVAFAVTVDGVETTLTEKQVDFIRHLPDSNFWENGVDSILWVDVLCDEIGGQFEGKPMTVGAMISTLCEKGLGVRGKEKVNGRKATSFALTGLGKVIAAELGLN